MSRIYDALREAESRRRARAGGERRAGRRFRTLAVVSNKGGVGKTTVATNLSVYLRALREDLPILALGLDDQPMPQRMFALPGDAPEPTLEDALRGGRLARAIRLGQYGVHYVPSSPQLSALKRELDDPGALAATLEEADRPGVIVVDTKSDLEILTRNALVAADRILVLVKDQASLHEAERVFGLVADLGRPRNCARVLLSLVDLRVKYADPGAPDVLALLRAEVERRGLPLLEPYLSRSPKIEALHTNPQCQVTPILHAAPESLVHQQFRRLAEDVLEWLAADGVREAAPAPTRPATRPTTRPLAGGALRWLLGGDRP